MMVLKNVWLANSNDVVNIAIDGGKISTLSADENSGTQISFENAVAFPGLINSHDHLDFNLFPQLGNRTYDNYVEWGEHIQHVHRAEIDAVLKIPVALRARWGMYKNLLCGVTTVVNHGVRLGIENPLITVFEDCQNLHSASLEPNLRLKLNNPLKTNIPIVIHTGEGTDISAFTEINALIRWTLLKRDLIGIHGVAMKPSQAENFKALVWCPQSNFFLLNKTADIKALKNSTNILFGTDSTLTSNWDIWYHLRLAQKTGMLNDRELYDSLTTTPAEVWKLNAGKLEPGKDADIVIAKDKGPLFLTTPEDLLMVIHRGHFRLFDESLAAQMPGEDLANYSKIQIGESCKYVQGDLPALMDEIKQYQPEAVFPVSGQQAMADMH